MNSNVKSKIILSVLIPLLAVFYFAATGITEKYRLISKFENLESLSFLSVKLSALIHEFQKERGRTDGFMGSDGKEFIEEMNKQRTLVDAKMEDLNVFLDDFHSEQFDAEFINKLQIAMQKINLVKKHRIKVDTLSISDEKAIGFYTELNSLILNAIAYAPKISPHIEVSSILSAYINFIKGKEYVGIERAVGTNAFAENKFDEETYNYFISLITAQDAYFDSFKIFASKEEFDFFEKIMSDPAVAETREMRNVAVSKANKELFGVSSAAWFDKMTIKINLLKEAEDKMANNLLLKMSDIKEKSKIELIVFSVIVFIAMFLSITLFISAFFAIKNAERA